MVTTMEVVMVLGVAGMAVGGSTSTFLMAARDSAPPTTHTTPTTAAGCGLACYAAGTRLCLSFVWRPLSSPRETGTANGCDSKQDGCGGDREAMALVDSRKQGRCAILSCVPHPASLVSSPGAQLYLRRGKAFLQYGSFKAPSSYEMACTFAFRVFSKVRFSYLEAERRCALDGAKLIAIKSAEEERVVQESVQAGDAYWIGLSDREQEGDWHLSDGSQPDYVNWDSGQPNNYERDGSDQDCAMLFQGAWNDNQCHQRLRFICQIRFLEL